MLGLGVFGLVDVTVDGTSTMDEPQLPPPLPATTPQLPIWLPFCDDAGRNELGDFNAILYDRGMPPFVLPNCMANDECIFGLFMEPLSCC